MKSFPRFLTCLLLCPLLIGCGGSGNVSSGGQPSGQAPGVNEILEAGVAAADAESALDAAESLSEEPEPAPTSQAAVSQDISPSAISAGEPVPAAGSFTPAESIPASEPLPTPEATDESVVLSYTEGIDIDLTALSSTMVYAEVYNMVFTPDDYLGKTVRMKGLFTSFHSEVTDKYYFACIVQDATACCAQGIEFIPAGDFSYPDDFPEDGSMITVTGVFGTYREGDYSYTTLKDAVIE
ncbi:MAG: hypothetical protein K6E30_04815 [Lachnospiraceae bacterium]|nr:hypothetical protein [Lachnospiraceae bacterium]